MNLFTPKPLSYQQYEKIDNDTARQITRWPGQRVCARIERIHWHETQIPTESNQE